ncbi:unnamed protein product [Symbiodinium necroappetens]|uniref:Uncharacterized protein n=1 Tax=Symbiodinium necroappetens TaxID=1628268 RepID=A0A813BVG6_9DINO|nr:unnamed protein product [Symbiodinium necroappetens]
MTWWDELDLSLRRQITDEGLSDMPVEFWTKAFFVLVPGWQDGSTVVPSMAKTVLLNYVIGGYARDLAKSYRTGSLTEGSSAVLPGRFVFTLQICSSPGSSAVQLHRPELTGVPSYESASLNFNTLDKNNRQLKRILLESWYPDRVHELLSDNEEDAAGDPVLDEEEYEPGSPNGGDLGEDVVPFINGRLDNQDEDEELEVSGHSNEDSNSGHAKQPTAEVVRTGNAGAAENEDSSAKQPTAEVVHTGNARAAENEDSTAKQPTAEVPGHPGNARAENQDSSAKQPTAEVCVHPGNARAENQDSSAKQPAGHMSDNGAVLASVAEASAQPELLIVSDDEEVPRKQQKEELKTTFRRGGPAHDDPSRVETQTFDLEAAVQSWQEVRKEVDPEPVDLQAVVASEASGKSDVLQPKRLAELEDAKESEVLKSRGVDLARAQSFAERAQSYDVQAAADEVLTKEKQDAMLTVAKAQEDEKPGHGRGGRGRGGRGRGGRGRGKTGDTSSGDGPKPSETPDEREKPDQPVRKSKNVAPEAAEPTEAKPSKPKRTKGAPELAHQPSKAKGSKDAKENGSEAEASEAQPAKAKPTRTKAAKMQASKAAVSDEVQPPETRTKAAQDNALEAAVAAEGPEKRGKRAKTSQPDAGTEAQPTKRTKAAKDHASEAPVESVPEADPPNSKRQQKALGSEPKRSRKNDAEEPNKSIRGTVAATDCKKAARKAIRDGLDMPGYCFVDIDFYWSRNAMGVKLRNCWSIEVLYLCYKDVPEHTAMITIWKFVKRADLVEKAKANMTPALQAKLEGIKDQFANRAEVNTMPLLMHAVKFGHTRGEGFQPIILDDAFRVSVSEKDSVAFYKPPDCARVYTMAKRLRSLGSCLWETDEVVTFEEWRASQPAVCCCGKDLQIRTLQDEIENLRALAQDLHVRLKVASLPTVPANELTVKKPALSRKQQHDSWHWLSLLPQTITELPRMQSDVIPSLQSTTFAENRVVFELCGATVPSAILDHCEITINSVFAKYPALYKIGITRNPVERWQIGYAKETHAWSEMKVLVAVGDPVAIGAGPYFAYVVYRCLVPPKSALAKRHLLSKAFSTATLQEALSSVDRQQVKEEQLDAGIKALEAELLREEMNAKRGTRCTPVAGATPSPQQATLKKHRGEVEPVEPEDSDCVLLENDQVLFTALKDQLGSPSPGPCTMAPIPEDPYLMDVSPAKPKHLFLSPYKPPSTPSKTPSKTPSTKTPYDPVADAETQPGKTPQRTINFMDTLVMESQGSPCPPTVMDPHGNNEVASPPVANPGLVAAADPSKGSGTSSGSKVDSDETPGVASLEKQFGALGLSMDSKQAAVVAAAEIAKGNGSTGGSAEPSKDAEIAKLKQMLFMMSAKLHAENDPQTQLAREAEREATREAVRAAAREAAQEALQSATCQAAAKEPSEGAEEVVGLQAARQRLRRMCAPRSSGALVVPKEVHEKYTAGGSQREQLLKLLIKNDFNKDSHDPYELLCSSMLTDSFVKEVVVLTEREKAVSLEISGDYFTEQELRDMKADTYNRKKPFKYWYETKCTASMKQSQLLRQSETVAYEQEMAIDGDEVTMGRDVAFDLSGFDATIGDHQLVGGGAPSAEDDLGLPSLEGKRPQDVADVYRKAIQTRSLKVANALGSLEAHPEDTRPPAVASCTALFAE